MLTTIKTDRLEYLEDKLNKLNKRACKLGLEIEFSYTVIRTYTEKKIIGEDCFLRPIWSYIEFSEIELTSNESLKLGNYDLIASVERLGEDIIINVNPLFPDSNLSNFRENNTGYCEHCKKSRKRKELVLLKRSNSTEQIFQVGKTCLKDFLGHNSPEKIVDLLNSFKKVFDIEEEYSLEKGKLLIDLQYAIALSFSYIRQKGYTGFKQQTCGSLVISTRQRVSYRFFCSQL